MKDGATHAAILSAQNELMLLRKAIEAHRKCAKYADQASQYVVDTVVRADEIGQLYERRLRDLRMAIHGHQNRARELEEWLTSIGEKEHGA